MCARAIKGGLEPSQQGVQTEEIGALTGSYVASDRSLIRRLIIFSEYKDTSVRVQIYLYNAVISGLGSPVILKTTFKTVLRFWSVFQKEKL